MKLILLAFCIIQACCAAPAENLGLQKLMRALEPMEVQTLVELVRGLEPLQVEAVVELVRTLDPDMDVEELVDQLHQLDADEVEELVEMLLEKRGAGKREVQEAREEQDVEELVEQLQVLDTVEVEELVHMLLEKRGTGGEALVELVRALDPDTDMEELVEQLQELDVDEVEELVEMLLEKRGAGKREVQEAREEQDVEELVEQLQVLDTVEVEELVHMLLEKRGAGGEALVELVRALDPDTDMEELVEQLQELDVDEVEELVEMLLEKRGAGGESLVELVRALDPDTDVEELVEQLQELDADEVEELVEMLLEKRGVGKRKVQEGREALVELVRALDPDTDVEELVEQLQELDADEVEELVELLLEKRVAEQRQQNTLNFESRKRELLADSAALTEAVQESQRKAVLQGKESRTGRLLKGYVKSTPYVQSLSSVAKRQLNALTAFKRDWDAHYGTNANNEGFWGAVRSSTLMTPSTCSRDEYHTGMCLQAREIDTCPSSDPDCTDWDNAIYYRSYDGSCNSQVEGQRWWGMAPTAQNRLVEAEYEDGVSEMRVTGDSGAALPNPRNVSRTINNHFIHSPAIFSYLVMQFGQFLDHDITHTDLTEVITENDDGTTTTADVECWCGMEETDLSYEDCPNISLLDNDPQVEATGRECMTFTRSAPVLSEAESCANGPRQQVNSVTAFIDCSQVYGSDSSTAQRLRHTDATRGMLDTTDHPTHPEWRPLLPYLTDEEQTDSCAQGVDEDDHRCFLAGDTRRNVQPGLAAMHTVWARLHNYIEENLHAQNPNWSGETLYQESRRLVIALTQHITYNEYLRVVLGRTEWDAENDNYDGAKIRVNQRLVDYVYSDSVNPGISNVFSTAGYRFGHSEINKYHRFIQQFTGDNNDCEADSQPENCVMLRNLWNDPTTVYVSPAGDEVPGVDAILLGILEEPSERVELWYTEEITDYLFTDDASYDLAYGYDLFALNIQRGRDHGLPGFMAYREYFGLDSTNSWDPVPDYFDEAEWIKLQSLYAQPEDIDVYAGGLLELHFNNAKTGDLFKYIMVDQFLKLKVGDRFWYEIEDQEWSFTAAQLTEIGDFTMSALLCATLDAPGDLPESSFWLYDPDDDESNPLLPCVQDVADDYTGDTHPEIDFSVFVDASKDEKRR